MRGFTLPHRRVVDAERRHDAGTKALDHDVGGARERQERRASVGVLRRSRLTERLPRLSATKTAFGCGSDRVERARVVAGAGVLDLDDVGAEVGEVQRRHRARQEARQVEHAHAGQRRGSWRRAGDAERRADRARRRERVVERRAEARDVAHLAAAAAASTCRTGAASRRGARAPRGQSGSAACAAPSNQRSPSRFTITAGVCCVGRPSGSPASTRACCSNCDVTHASIV